MDVLESWVVWKRYILYKGHVILAIFSFNMLCNNVTLQFAAHAFSSPEAALLLVSTKNRDLWLTSGQVQHRKSAIHGLPVTLRMFRVKPDKSDWLWSQSIVFTKPVKNGIMSLDWARGRDSWCWPKGARPLGTRMQLMLKVLLRTRQSVLQVAESWRWR